MSINLLVVDDEAIIRRGITKMVKNNNQFIEEVFQAETGREALTILKKTDDIQIMFIDINLPDMNGLDLARQAKILFSEMILVIISGYDDFHYARQAIHLQVFDYLIKPVPQSDIKYLLKKLENQIKSNKSCMQDTKEGQDNLAYRAEQYILENYGKKDLNLAMVSYALFVDSSYLSKQMKKKLGLSFNEYVTSVRIKKAKELLEKSTIYSILEIAEKVGYSNQHYFSRMFKQQTGKTPSDYRNDVSI